MIKFNVFLSAGYTLERASEQFGYSKFVKRVKLIESKLLTSREILHNNEFEYDLVPQFRKSNTCFL